MEIQSIIVRKVLFGGLKGSWSRPMSVENFVLDNMEPDERERVIGDKERIKFVSSDGSVLEYNKGVDLYRLKESDYLAQFLDTAISSMGIQSLDFS